MPIAIGRPQAALHTAFKEAWCHVTQ